MRIEQLEYVLTVARYGSLSKAAANIYVGQPTLSAAIASLEKELGKPLFHRTRRGMELTSLGETLLPFIEKTIDDFYAIKKKAGLFAPPDMHIHLIAANPCMTVLYTAVMRAQEIFPTVQFYLRQSHLADIMPHIIQKNASLGLSFAFDYDLARHRNYAQSRNLRLMPLYHDSLCLIARSDGRFSNTACINFSDFDHTMPVALPLDLLHTGSGGTHSMWGNLPTITGIDDREMLKRYVSEKDALGCTTLLQANQDAAIQNGDFQIIRLAECSVNIVHYLCYTKNRQVNDIEADLIQQIENYYDYLAL